MINFAPNRFRLVLLGASALAGVAVAGQGLAQTADAQAQAAQTAGAAEHQRVFHGAPPAAIGVNNAGHL